MQSAMMHNDAKKQIFLDFFNKNEIIKQKNDFTTPRLCKNNKTTLTQITKVKNTLKKVSLVRNRGVYRL